MSRFWQLFGPALHERLDSLIRKHLLAAWLPVMIFTKQIRQKFSLSAMTLRTQAASACDKRCSVSTQHHRRSVHTVISQGNAVMFCQGIVLFRAKQLSRLRNKERKSVFEVTQTNNPALLGWDTSAAREAPGILQRIVDMQCNLQTVLESCHFFEANVNHQVLQLQISFLFDFALQQVSKVSALQHISIRSCRSSAHVAERMKIQQFEIELQTARSRKVS